MKSYIDLPETYVEIEKVDFKEKKLALKINGLALIVMILMAVVANHFVPIFSLFIMEEGLLIYFLRTIVLLIGIFAYIILHEAVHGIFMKYYGKAKPDFGLTLMYAYAGSKAYFCKKHYIIIALAPIVIWGVVLAVANVLVPISWFWCIYCIQIMNISGAMGDLYMTWKLQTMQKDILIQDSGVGMIIYAPNNNEI